MDVFALKTLVIICMGMGGFDPQYTAAVSL